MQLMRQKFSIYLCRRLHNLSAINCTEVVHVGKLPTDCLQETENEKARYVLDSRLSISVLVGRHGLEPWTKGL